MYEKEEGAEKEKGETGGSKRKEGEDGRKGDIPASMNMT